MRYTLCILALATLPLAAQTTKKTTTHSTARHTAHRAVTAKKAVTPVPAPIPGLAAVGDMPAVTGAPANLYALQYVDTVIGTGELAQPHKWYTVNYTGWTLDGKKFDSSLNPGREPFVFPYGARRVIAGWDTGFEGMRVGGKRRLIVPYQLAYGERGAPPDIPAKATLVFDVEFLGQSDTPPQPPATPAPPASQTKPTETKPAESTPKPEASKPATDSTQK